MVTSFSICKLRPKLLVVAAARLLLVSSGITVTSGTVVTLRNNRTVKVNCLRGSASLPCLVRSRKLNVAEDSVRFRFNMTVSPNGRLNMNNVSMLTIELASSIRVSLMLNIDPCTIYKCCGDNLRLTTNSSNIMFSLETRSMSRGPLTNFSIDGLTTILVNRQFSIVFNRRCPVNGMASIVVNRNMIVVRNKPFLRGTIKILMI